MGKRDARETHLNKNWGDRVTMTVRRGGKDVDLAFQFPDEPPNR